VIYHLKKIMSHPIMMEMMTQYLKTMEQHLTSPPLIM